MKKIIVRILTFQAIYILSKSNAKMVVITGSIGKTSTTQAIATILEQQFKVTKTIKNYNTDIGVPCSIIGINFPESLKNPFAWGRLIIKGFIKLYKKNKTEVYVLELGTDLPGEIAQFEWLRPDIAVVTAIAPEHIEYFKNIDTVAREELSVSEFSDVILINKNMVAKKYLDLINNDEIYNYSRDDIRSLNLKSKDLLVTGDHSIDAIAAGIGVGKRLGIDYSLLKKGAVSIKSQPGRMRKFKGIKNSTLIDDTYNSSPEAVIAALNYIYSEVSSQKIVLLGNMNELGDTSEAEHIKIGKYCNPKELDLVVTLGPDANKYTSVEAEKSGCKVVKTDTPYEAASVISDNLKDSSLVVLKGSQNKVFAEEATKMLLKNPDDSKYLVRQSPFWHKIKIDCFKEFVK